MAEKSSYYPAITVKILTGAHDQDMVDDVVNGVPDCDAILYEMVADKATKDWQHSIGCALLQNPGQFSSEDLTKLEAMPHPFNKIMYSLRGSEKDMFLVDRTLDETGLEQELDLFNLYDDSDISSLNRHNLPKLYAKVNDRLNSLIASRIERDALVARQVHNFVDRVLLQDPVDPNFQARICVVQGQKHDIANNIVGLMPGIKIERAGYGRKAAGIIADHPLNRLVDKKLKQSDQPVGDNDIERFLLAVTDPRLTAPTSESPADDRRHAMGRGTYQVKQDDLSIVLSRLTSEIDDMSDQKVHETWLRRIDEISKR